MSDASARAITELPPGLPAGANAAELKAHERSERWSLLGLTSPAIIMVLVIMVLPVGWLFYLSFIGSEGTFSMENYTRMLESKAYGRIFWTTFQVSFLTTGICILIGYPLAYFLAQLPSRAANICMLAVLLPFWTSLLVRTYAWLVLLQRRGLVNEWGMGLGLWDEPLPLVHNLNGTLIGMVHIMLPFLILPLYSSMKAISPDYLKAASNLGATPTDLLAGVLPVVLAGSVCRFADRVRAVPRLLRHAGGVSAAARSSWYRTRSPTISSCSSTGVRPVRWAWFCWC
jgi:ABC-type spermidine/putrescine transport system permease subunit I